MVRVAQVVQVVQVVLVVQVVQVVQMVQVVSWGSLSDTKSDHFLLFFTKILILEGTIDIEFILL